jgi:hypothetical protein
MSDVPQQLAIRLKRRPSPLVGLLGRAVFVLVWTGGIGGFIALSWPHRAEVPLVVKGILGLFALIGLGMIWDLAARAYRAATGKTAVVEIDRQPLAAGQAAQVRVVQADPQSLKTLVVKLVGENTVTERSADGSTTITRTAACHEQELFTFQPEAGLSEDQIDRTFPLKMPAQFPDGKVSWKILVACELRQGGQVFDGFPIQVA